MDSNLDKNVYSDAHNNDINLSDITITPEFDTIYNYDLYRGEIIDFLELYIDSDKIRIKPISN